MITDFMKALEEKIVKTEKFQYAGDSHATRFILLKEGGAADDPANIVKAWTLVYDEARKINCLRLYDADSTVITIMMLTRTCEWQGRERKTQHTLVLRPMPLGDRTWELFKDPKNYYTSLVPDEKAPAFQYVEPLPRQLDWGKYQQDIREIVGVEKFGEEAVALIAYNRLEYFSQTVQSIALNKEVQELPIFVFLDKCDDPRIRNAHLEAARTMFPKCYMIERPITYGCGRNIIDARMQLFDRLNFQRVWIFEDDLVISPFYMRVVKQLFEWGRENFSNVGAAQGWAECRLKKEEKEPKLGEVFSTYENWWGYLMSKEAWDSIKEFIYSYTEMFLGGEYGRRPHKSIVNWFRLYQRRNSDKIGDKPFEESQDSKQQAKNYFNEPPSGQDAATMVSFRQNGWIRLAPRVNRGKYIGQYGIHMNPSYYSRRGYNQINLDMFLQDRFLKTFVET